MKTRPLLATAAVTALVLGTAGVASASDTTGTGTGQVPAALAAQLTDARAGVLASEVVGAGTVRISGGDRYETSAEVARLWDPEDTTIVYLASGEGYADALSMGASTLGLGPLLLTPRDALPPSTVTELERLSPCYVFVVGGPSAVSDTVARQADSYTDPAACEQ